MSKILSQLSAAGRVTDAAGVLVWERFEEDIYSLSRHREAGMTLERLQARDREREERIVDVVTDAKSAAILARGLKCRFARKYGWDEAELKQRKIQTDGRIDLLYGDGCDWVKFEIPEVGAHLAIITNGTMLAVPDGELWLIDMSDVTLDGTILHPEYHRIFTNVKTVLFN